MWMKKINSNKEREARGSHCIAQLYRLGYSLSFRSRRKTRREKMGMRRTKRSFLLILRDQQPAQVFQIPQNPRLKGWRDGAVIKGTSCSSRRLGFNSQHPHVSSQPSVTPVSVDPVPPDTLQAATNQKPSFEMPETYSRQLLQPQHHP